MPPSITVTQDLNIIIKIKSRLELVTIDINSNSIYTAYGPYTIGIIDLTLINYTLIYKLSNDLVYYNSKNIPTIKAIKGIN
jgi:hypothetical protein